MAKSTTLPGREDEYTGDIVIIPRHLLLAEEADDLWWLLTGWLKYEWVVEECAAVEEDGLGLEKELREEGEILSVELEELSFYRAIP